jgi:hypothetical protein
MNLPALLVFPPESACSASTSVSSQGGDVAASATVYLLFWGQDWQTHIDPSTGRLLSDAFTTAVQSILDGPWMAGLRQYGVHRCRFGSSSIVGTDPPFLPHTFDEGDVQDMIQTQIDAGAFPNPEQRGHNLYIVFMPPNTKHVDVNGEAIAGEHSSFLTDGNITVSAWYAFICTNPFDETIRAFSHELAEMCTDPEDDGWKVPDGSTACSEIGDLCNSSTGPVGPVNNVEAYWSIHEGACIIPTIWSVRRTLAWAGIKLEGKGLRSLHDPIPSLNQLIVNL